MDHTDTKLNLPKAMLKKAILKSKKHLLHENYLTLTNEKAFQLALEMSDFALSMRLSQEKSE